MAAGDITRDRKAEPGTTGDKRPTAVEPVEGTEGLFAPFRRNAGAIVVDDHVQHMGLLVSRNTNLVAVPDGILD